MEELKTIKDSIKKEIEKEKEKLLNSNEAGGIRFFLDSITEDIREMITAGFSYKQQLEIINRSSSKTIKYNTYLRYVKRNLGQSQNRVNLLQRENQGRKVSFSHEALPDVNELY